MQQHKSNKPNRPALRPASDRRATVPTTIHNRPSVSSGMNSRAQHELAALTHAVERLTEKVESLERTHVAPSADRTDQPEGWLARLLGGKFNGLLALGSSAITVVPVLVGLSLEMLKRLPLAPGSAPSTTVVVALFRPLWPEVAIIVVAAISILSSGLLKRKSQRFRFIKNVMTGYGLVTTLYVAWISLSFLHYNTLASGVLFTLTWGILVSVSRRARGELSAMEKMIQVQMEKEEQAKSSASPVLDMT